MRRESERQRRITGKRESGRKVVVSSGLQTQMPACRSRCADMMALIASRRDDDEAGYVDMWLAGKVKMALFI